jgi:hypothetical protein
VIGGSKIFLESLLTAVARVACLFPVATHLVFRALESQFLPCQVDR